MIAHRVAPLPRHFVVAKIGAMAEPERTPRLLHGLLFASPLSGYYPRSNGFGNGVDDEINLCLSKLGEHW